MAEGGVVAEEELLRIVFALQPRIAAAREVPKMVVRIDHRQAVRSHRAYPGKNAASCSARRRQSVESFGGSTTSAVMYSPAPTARARRLPVSM